MATIRVTNQAELLSALKTATGGDTVLLADGDYGEVKLKNTFSSNVTIKAENEGGANFTKIWLSGASNMTFDGLHLDGGFNASNKSSNISLLNIDSDNLLYFRNVSNLTVDHTTAQGGQFSILLNSVQNFSVTNSTFGGVTEDVMRITGNSYNGLIENNVIADTIASKPTHPDLIQIFGYGGYTPHDITIRGNLIYDDPTTGDSNTAAQGIFLAAPGEAGYKNILIEENLIYTRSTQSIFINGGVENVSINNNSLISSSGDGGAIIRVLGDSAGTTVTGNIAKIILNESGLATVTDNYVYGRNADLLSLFHGTDGTSWESFLTADGSAAEGYGATSRLAELLKQYGVIPDTDGASDSGNTDDSADGGVVAVPPKQPVEQPAEQPSTQPTDINTIFKSTGSYEIEGSKKTVVAVGHNDAMELSEASIALTFNADSISGNRGLISKGAADYDDDISAWIQNGKLIVCLENDNGEQVRLSYSGITTNTDYDLLITLQDGKVKVWLDDTMIGAKDFDFDLSSNTEALVIGGVNGSSTRGTTDKVNSYFDGTISNVGIYDHVLTPAELNAYEALQHDANLSLTGLLAA